MWRLERREEPIIKPASRNAHDTASSKCRRALAAAASDGIDVLRRILHVLLERARLLVDNIGLDRRRVAHDGLVLAHAERASARRAAARAAARVAGSVRHDEGADERAVQQQRRPARDDARGGDPVLDFKCRA